MITFLRKARRGLPALRTLMLATAAFGIFGQAHGASSVLIWPIDPVIESDERSSALWLENRGKAPAQLQLRIFGWRQVDGEDQYDEQEAVIGSPPMLRIEPGKKQLVRLIRTGSVATGEERAYRIVVDEIPLPGSDTGSDADKGMVRFQMRFSVPLFVYGAGLWVKENPRKPRDVATAAKPSLSWKKVVQDGKTYLEIANTGPVHARLTNLTLQQGDRRFGMSDGLLGYVLPGARMRWPAPDNLPDDAILRAAVNGPDHMLDLPPTP